MSLQSIIDMVRRMITTTNEGLHEMRIEIDELKKQVAELKEQQYDGELYEMLRIERNTIAKEREIKPFYILSNETLKELSRKKPSTLDKLKEIKGIKDVKTEQYGERILQIITNYLIETH